MKKPASVVVVAVLALGAGVGVDSAVAGMKPAPVLRVVSLHPLTILGLNFKARERVTVTLLAGKRSTVSRVAESHGRFTAKFPAVAVTKCSAFTVRAVGAHSPAALLKTEAASGCSPAGAGTKPPATGSTATNAKAAAEVVFASTVSVKGTGFKPGEAVTVKLEGDQAWTRHAKASTTGSFAVDFGALTLNECSAYTLTVTGTQGSHYIFEHALVPC